MIVYNEIVFNISTVFNKRKKEAKKEKNSPHHHCQHFLGLDTKPGRSVKPLLT